MPRDSDDFTMRNAEPIPAPDMSVLRNRRRPPPTFPLDAVGPFWAAWIKVNAAAAACPPDYVALPLLASVSALIGNARWAGDAVWCEPPHLWCACVGDSGTGKSPGSDALLRVALPELERRMVGDYPERQRAWQVAAEAANASREKWKAEVKEATKTGHVPPSPPEAAPPEPQMPRLRQNDVTVEKVAHLLASAAPKGLLIVRDEIAGWFSGMTAYNEAGRSFWIEAYGGRPYQVERVKHPEPIQVPRLAVAVMGGTQPDKLTEMMRAPDDGLLARILWGWPDPVPFRLAIERADETLSLDALDRLRTLDLMPGNTPDAPSRPLLVPLSAEARALMEDLGREMQEAQESAAGLMRSAFGKARGHVLRLALVLEHLWWCASSSDPVPTSIGPTALNAAAMLVVDYFIPMAERVFGDASTTPDDRNAATLARWVMKTRTQEVHVRTVQRSARLPGLRDAETIHAACRQLVEAGWLIEPQTSGAFVRRRESYLVRPEVFEAEQ